MRLIGVIGGEVGSLVAGFIALIPEVSSLRDLWVALDLAMDANPIGAMVIAATALAAAGYAVYEDWSKE